MTKGGQRTVGFGLDVGQGATGQPLDYDPEVRVEEIGRLAKPIGQGPGTPQVGSPGFKLGGAELRREAEADERGGAPGSGKLHDTRGGVGRRRDGS